MRSYVQSVDGAANEDVFNSLDQQSDQIALNSTQSVLIVKKLGE